MDEDTLTVRGTPVPAERWAMWVVEALLVVVTAVVGFPLLARLPWFAAIGALVVCAWLIVTVVTRGLGWVFDQVAQAAVAREDR